MSSAPAAVTPCTSFLLTRPGLRSIHKYGFAKTTLRRRGLTNANVGRECSPFGSNRMAENV